jgi:hypothetical protein
VSAVAPLAEPAPVVTPLVGPAPAAACAATLEDVVVAAPDWAARRDRVTAVFATADGDRAARLGQALAVLAHLERADRSDVSIVRLFVRAALADDPAIRAAAVDAASVFGDPPLLAVAAGTPGATSQSGATSQFAAPPCVTPPAPASAEALRTYKARRLERSEFTAAGLYYMPMNSGFYGRGFTSLHMWTVTDGGGERLRGDTFARLTGDREKLARFEPACWHPSSRRRTGGASSAPTPPTRPTRASRATTPRSAASSASPKTTCVTSTSARAAPGAGPQHRPPPVRGGRDVLTRRAPLDGARAAPLGAPGHRAHLGRPTSVAQAPTAPLDARSRSGDMPV